MAFLSCRKADPTATRKGDAPESLQYIALFRITYLTAQLGRIPPEQDEIIDHAPQTAQLCIRENHMTTGGRVHTYLITYVELQVKRATLNTGSPTFR